MKLVFPALVAFLAGAQSVVVTQSCSALSAPIAPGGYRPAPVIRTRRMPFGFVRFAPMTPEGLKQHTNTRRGQPRVARGLGRKGYLMARLATR